MSLHPSTHRSLGRNYTPGQEKKHFVNSLCHSFHLFDNTHFHYLIRGQITEVQSVVDGHWLDQCSMEELAKLCHQATPLVLLGVITEEAVQWGVKGVCDLHLWSQSVNDTATSTGLRVEDGSWQRADWGPGLGQRVVILHLEDQTKWHSLKTDKKVNVVSFKDMLFLSHVKGCNTRY